MSNACLGLALCSARTALVNIKATLLLRFDVAIRGWYKQVLCNKDIIFTVTESSSHTLDHLLLISAKFSIRPLV